MNDPFFEVQIDLAFSFPELTLLYLVGVVACVLGIAIATVCAGISEKCSARGIALMVGGALIAAPVAIQALMSVVGGNISTPLPSWVSIVINVAFPIMGSVSGAYIWWYYSKSNGTGKLNT